MTKRVITCMQGRSRTGDALSILKIPVSLYPRLLNSIPKLNECKKTDIVEGGAASPEAMLSCCFAPAAPCV